jgi:hypothetical protein
MHRAHCVLFRYAWIHDCVTQGKSRFLDISPTALLSFTGAYLHFPQLDKYTMEKYGDKPTGDIEVERAAAKTGDDKQEVEENKAQDDKSAAPITITEKPASN